MFEFKKIIFRLACFSRRDQRWILQHLPEKLSRIFQALNGEELLKQAQGFRYLKQIPAKYSRPPEKPSLPSYCKELATKTPLYIAIILEKGQYSWHKQFLDLYDQQGKINEILALPMTIKTACQDVLFQDWQQCLSFEAHLEVQHG